MRRVQRGRRRQTFSFEPRSGPFRAVATSRRWVALVVGVSLVVAAAGVTTVVWQLRRSAEARSRAEVDRIVRGFVSDWERSDWARMRRLVSNSPKDFASTYRRFDRSLHLEKKMVVQPGPASVNGSTSRAPFVAHVAVEGLGEWTYRGELSLTKFGGRW